MAVTKSLANESDDPEDAAAQAQASEAREEGIDMIREHLSQHLSQNPSSSYVTWIATLHPENATVTIDPRFMIEGNPWKTVYSEAKYHGYRAPADTQAVEAVAAPEDTKPRSFGGFIDCLVALIITTVAASLTFMLEIMAASFRLVARSFEYLHNLCYDCCITKYTIGILFWIMWRSFWFCDHVLVYTSVFVTELLAAIGWFLCAIFACDCGIGCAVHQRTRRISHLIRWACRHPCGGSKDGDHFPPQTVQEVPVEQVMPTATALPDGTIASIPAATVISIHDDMESNRV